MIFFEQVVELSDLDNRTNPEQKIDCLLTAYDLIFAEIKGAIAEIISTLPSRYLLGQKVRRKPRDYVLDVVENVVIPTIDNWEIPQLLIAVIVRSKPLHWASNLYYIKAFGGEQKDFLRHEWISRFYFVIIPNISGTFLAITRRQSND